MNKSEELICAETCPLFGYDEALIVLLVVPAVKAHITFHSIFIE